MFRELKVVFVLSQSGSVFCFVLHKCNYCIAVHMYMYSLRLYWCIFLMSTCRLYS